jgi:hypothetical protein
MHGWNDPVNGLRQISKATRADIAQLIADIAAIDASDIAPGESIDWTGLYHAFSDTTAVKLGDLGLAGNTGKDLLLKALAGQSVLAKVDGTTVLTIAAALITAAQAIKAANGSVGTPGVHFAGDVDTGLGLISSKLAMIFGGAAVMDFDGTTIDGKAQNFTTTGKYTSNDGTNPSIFKSGIKPKDSGTGSDTINHFESLGTWVPALSYATPGTSSWTYNASFTNGYYEKIGKWVSATAIITWTAYSLGTGSGLLYMSLPYAAANVANETPVGNYSILDASTITVPTGCAFAAPQVIANSTNAFFAGWSTAGAVLNFDTANAGFALDGTGQMVVTIKYEATS